VTFSEVLFVLGGADGRYPWASRFG
jgi:hypothetical protein